MKFHQQLAIFVRFWFGKMHLHVCEESDSISDYFLITITFYGLMKGYFTNQVDRGFNG